MGLGMRKLGWDGFDSFGVVSLWVGGLAGGWVTAASGGGAGQAATEQQSSDAYRDRGLPRFVPPCVRVCARVRGRGRACVYVRVSVCARAGVCRLPNL